MELKYSVLLNCNLLDKFLFDKFAMLLRNTNIMK